MNSLIPWLDLLVLSLLLGIVSGQCTVVSGGRCGRTSDKCDTFRVNGNQCIDCGLFRNNQCGGNANVCHFFKQINQNSCMNCQVGKYPIFLESCQICVSQHHFPSAQGQFCVDCSWRLDSLCGKNEPICKDYKPVNPEYCVNCKFLNQRWTKEACQFCHSEFFVPDAERKKCLDCNTHKGPECDGIGINCNASNIEWTLENCQKCHNNQFVPDKSQKKCIDCNSLQGEQCDEDHYQCHVHNIKQSESCANNCHDKDQKWTAEQCSKCFTNNHRPNAGQNGCVDCLKLANNACGGDSTACPNFQIDENNKCFDCETKNSNWTQKQCQTCFSESHFPDELNRQCIDCSTIQDNKECGGNLCQCQGFVQSDSGKCIDCNKLSSNWTEKLCMECFSKNHKPNAGATGCVNCLKSSENGCGGDAALCDGFQADEKGQCVQCSTKTSNWTEDLCRSCFSKNHFPNKSRQKCIDCSDTTETDPKILKRCQCFPKSQKMFEL